MKTFSVNVSEYNFTTVEPILCTHIWHVIPAYRPFSYLTFFLCSRFIGHIISINVPLNFNLKIIRGHICMQICSWNVKSSYFSPIVAPITSMVNNSPRDIFGNATISCFLPLAQFPSLMIPFIFLYLLHGF